MNYLWAVMILVGILYGAFHGTLPAVANGALESAKEAVTLCITMAGVMSFWVGLMEIAQKGGIIDGLSRRLRPLLRFLFPGLPMEHPACRYIATNMIANIFGLGWAATPAGLKAMKELEKLEAERGNPEYLENFSGARRASREMCTFLIINISSLQLIPVNIIGYRQQYGSVSPTAIIAPAILCTAVSTLAAIVFCKVMDGIARR